MVKNTLTLKVTLELTVTFTKYLKEKHIHDNNKNEISYQIIKKRSYDNLADSSICSCTFTYTYALINFKSLYYVS